MLVQQDVFRTFAGSFWLASHSTRNRGRVGHGGGSRSAKAYNRATDFSPKSKAGSGAGPQGGAPFLQNGCRINFVAMDGSLGRAGKRRSFMGRDRAFSGGGFVTGSLPRETRFAGEPGAPMARHLHAHGIDIPAQVYGSPKSPGAGVENIS